MFYILNVYILLLRNCWNTNTIHGDLIVQSKSNAIGTIPGTLNGIKSSVFNDMSHYNYETIQLHWFEDWNIDVIGITTDPLDLHQRNPIELMIAWFP